MALERNDERVSRQRYRWAGQHIGPHIETVVDVGCGLGYGPDVMRAAIAETERRIMPLFIGVDYWEPAAGKMPRVILADIGRQTFHGFDMAVCLETFCHLPDPYMWLKNLDTREAVISLPTTPSKAEYPYRKHDMDEITFRALFEPRWQIVDSWKQQSGSHTYMTVHATRGSAE